MSIKLPLSSRVEAVWDPRGSYSTATRTSSAPHVRICIVVRPEENKDFPLRLNCCFMQITSVWETDFGMENSWGCSSCLAFRSPKVALFAPLWTASVPFLTGTGCVCGCLRAADRRPETPTLHFYNKHLCGSPITVNDSSMKTGSNI